MRNFKAQLFLWNGRGLYIGTGLDSTLHKHTAIQIGLSFEQPFGIKPHTSSDYTYYQAFLMKPNVLHQIKSADIPSIFLWIEPESRLGQLLINSYPEQSPVRLNLSTLNVLPNSEAALDCKQATSFFDTVIEQLVMSSKNLSSSSIPLDERIDRVIELINQQKVLSNSLSIAQLSDQLYLSPSRLRHLFSEQVGIALHQYILWQRLLNSLQNTLKTGSLTQAAHDSGFADAAHMSRTFHQTFGLKPSQILKNSQFIQAISCQDY